MEKTRRVVVTGYGAVTALGAMRSKAGRLSWPAVWPIVITINRRRGSTRAFALLEAEPPLEALPRG